MASGPPNDEGQETTLYVFPSSTRIYTALIRRPGPNVMAPGRKGYQLVRYGSFGQVVVLAELTIAEVLQLGLVCAVEVYGKRIFP